MYLHYNAAFHSLLWGKAAKRHRPWVFAKAWWSRSLSKQRRIPVHQPSPANGLYITTVAKPSFNAAFVLVSVDGASVGPRIPTGYPNGCQLFSPPRSHVIDRPQRTDKLPHSASVAASGFNSSTV
ncbi:hypothetical protein [Rhizobium lusitanum]|uniref:Uncharacterized protein n=1 Tax=Rhizobium lusitanum TaxID=293958 RepID=A0A7X0ISP6_9HYPH|nr:hypothetical protein [Rhizobium lusitanum]MBB6486446.1 hypothetical protein [Rhizobium lusitanum]